MKTLKLIGSLLISLMLFSCSSTPDTSSSRAFDYHQTTYERTQFEVVNKTTVKKEFASDHHLLMSLLDRPMTADRLMMLAFTQQAQQQHSSPFVNYVDIRGDKTQDNKYLPVSSYYSNLVAKDINSIAVNGTL